MEEMYSDYPLEIYRSEKFISTISQPSFVMLMIDMLELKPGMKVLELGAGSGWNAALMSYMVGETGKVISVEIIPELAEESRQNLADLGFKNVQIISGDGARGFPSEAPYDRGIFTAGATDLPKAFHEQIKVGGRLLFVLKTFDIDLLLLLVKKEHHFEELSRMHCSFVPMMGEKKASITDTDQVETDGHLKISLNKSGGSKDSVFSIT
jgi:protein-L-isoaspartate(D-aspartate) O-methyltransferase